VNRSYASLSLLSLALGLVLSGCPGDLDDPARFGYEPEGEAGTGATCPSDYDVVADLFANRCGGAACHGEGSAFVDLVSPGVVERVLDQDSPSCSMPFVSSTDPASSYLLRKTTDSPGCGSQMPLGGSLSAVEQACLQSWVESLASGSGPPTAMDAAADAAMDAAADASAEDAAGS
jgi:hypothetical protein